MVWIHSTPINLGGGGEEEGEEEEKEVILAIDLDCKIQSLSRNECCTVLKKRIRLCKDTDSLWFIIHSILCNNQESSGKTN